ncbi:helix-turn-helix transcriptional regulator [Lederbergia galactosidilytica]|uniref:AraC family transcriptional regulator n=1 Tax=Lederbergia galactosidilytica TaxID=217031 RepID=A0A177ZKS9_9BACI|nr:AraC family transcriptional regulator [Lederbergia galactosidilytica]KRG08909.1 AraC family transcriptional regulator [Virgibacillus soli]MBP1916153.1 AraC-like DNA-binding protein [Lederbergia galactosidilytica]OAK68394.1 AraC family transcriptional regulator [Lederbergia galactosidilytica]
MVDNFGPKYYLENESFSLQFMYRKGYSAMSTPHAHAFYELYYLRKGERVYFINGKVYTVKSGDIIVINPHDVHRTTSSSVPEFERILINFTHDFLESGILSSDLPLLPFQHGSQLIRFPVKEQPNTEQLIFEMLRECKKKQPGYTFYVKALLTKLLIQIYRQSFQAPPENEHPMYEKISEIATYLHQHYLEELTLKKIAGQFYISPSYLSRTFKKVTGFYFSEYVQAVRMREARRQLIESDEKVLTIAGNVGFHSIAHFNKTFKKMTGVSPIQFRKQNKHLSYEEQKGYLLNGDS